MATIRPDALAASGSPSLSLKPLPTPTLITKIPEKRTVTAPRIDIEPLYTTIKSSLSDADWSTYKTTLSAFLLGNLNQTELSTILSPILSTPALEHAHNQFVVGVFGNCLRDAPEPGVASWVSASDKMGAGGGGGAGKGGHDEVEKRVKGEVMGLSRRERKRLKMVQESPYDSFTQLMTEYHDARRIKVPDTGPASAGGFQKTNWDLEIRKRYTQPLFTETHEFPDAATIEARMLPICYEYGLPNGHTSDCASFMNTATETFIKEALTNLFQRISSNGTGYIRTADFKKRVEREEGKVARGELGRTAAGLLPVEVEEQRKRRPLCMEDLRLALELGDSYLGQVPLISAQIATTTILDTPSLTALLEEPESKRGLGGMVNGDHAVNGATAGYTVELGDPMAVEEDWTWQGGSVQDVDGLDAVLDGCLTVGV